MGHNRSATAGGWTDDTNMSWDPVNGVFKITINVGTAGSFKFRANDSWDYNLGGSLNALTQEVTILVLPSVYIQLR